MDYWSLTEESHKLATQDYELNSTIYDSAIEAWNDFNLVKVYKDYHQVSVVFVTYRMHMDKALRRAIDSCMSANYDQAIYNLRLAVENAGIVLFAYGDNDSAIKLFEDGKNAKFDSKIRTASIEFLKTVLPGVSSKLADLHKMADTFGSHQTLAVHKNYMLFNEDEKGVKLTGNGQYRLELTVGICGIVMGLIVEMQDALSQLPKPEWINLDEHSGEHLEALRTKLNRMKVKYLPLFLSLANEP